METTPCAIRIPRIFYRRARTLEFITRHARPSILISITRRFFSLLTFSLQISRHRERGRSRSFLPTRRSFFEWQLPDFSPFPISLSLSRLAADPASVRWEPKNVPSSASLTPSPNVFLMRQHKRSRRSPPIITARGFLKGSHWCDNLSCRTYLCFLYLGLEIFSSELEYVFEHWRPYQHLHLSFLFYYNFVLHK